MTKDEIISGLEREIKRIRKEPKRKMLGIFMTVDEAEDIVTMLKEQEPVEPEHNLSSITGWFCGKCGRSISRFEDYCSSCGQAVKWE